MSKIPQSKDEALEALDFIVNVLKEHEKDLDKLINELATVTEQIGETGELSSKVEKVEEKINNIQKEVANLIGYMSSAKREPPQPVVKESASAPPASILPLFGGPSIVIKCQQWEDFLNLVGKAQTLSFNYEEAERLFQVSALKGNQVITYNGALPKLTEILKAYLSKQLDIPQQAILEGILALS